MKTKEREILVEFVSEETRDMQTSLAPCWCDNYYRQLDADEKLSKEKQKFDAKIKFWIT